MVSTGHNIVDSSRLKVVSIVFGGQEYRAEGPPDCPILVAAQSFRWAFTVDIVG